MSVSFDDIAPTYDKELKESFDGFYQKDISIFAAYKVKIVAQECGRPVRTKMSMKPTRLLEFGCGTGRNSPFLSKWFPESHLFGCDISEKSLSVAENMNPAVRYDVIKSPDDLTGIYQEPFDCIFVSNVFHHIPFSEHQLWFDALSGLLSKDGSIFIFEHNPYNPFTKRVFKNSRIDKGAEMLTPEYCIQLLQKAGFNNIKRKYTLFFTWRNAFFECLERLLWWLPWGAQYYVWGQKNIGMTVTALPSDL